jgi:hypothetical protein
MPLNSDIRTLVLQHGKNKVRALIPLRPLRTLFFISYTSSSDPTLPVLCEVDEFRYDVNEGYKIEWKPISDYEKAFAKESYYQTDFDLLVKRGTVKVYVEA